jgi:lipid A disaccharide synthetase
VVPELIQDNFTAHRVASEAQSLLSGSQSDNSRVLEMERGLQEVQKLLGPPGAVDRAADEIARLLQAVQSNAM